MVVPVMITRGIQASDAETVPVPGTFGAALVDQGDRVDCYVNARQFTPEGGNDWAGGLAGL